MGRRRKKRFLYLKLNQKSTRSVSALILLLLSFLTILFYLGQAASYQSFVQDFINKLFGKGAIFVPILLFLAGLSLTQIKWEIAQPRVFFGSCLFVLSLLSLGNLFLKNEGGLIGNSASSFAASLLSGFGAFLLFFASLIISILIIFNTSLDVIVLWLVEKLQPLISFVRLYILGRTFEYMNNSKEQKEKSKEQEKEEEKEKREIKIIGPTEPEVEIVSEAKERSAATPTPAFKDTPYRSYELPPLSLLSEPEEVAADRGDVKKNAEVIEKTLESFGISAHVSEVNLGPAVTQYALSLAEGTKLSKITSLSNDIAMALAAPTGTVRIEAPIPGKSLLGVEVPNYSPTLVTLKSVLTAEVMRANNSKIAVALGHNVAGQAMVADIGKWPHVLIAGATGSGKSVLLQSFLTTILFRATPDEVKLILVDPKRVELTQFASIPHLLSDVVVEIEKVVTILKWAVSEMDKRYRIFQEVKTRNIADYNEAEGMEKMPYVIIMVDELADLMAFAPAEVENLVCRIAQMSRATGIHLVLSTQRPSVDVLTGLIKANIPARIALNVTSGTDSRVIIDTTGAEKLLGRGDMLYLPPDIAKPIRIQGVLVTKEELKRVISYWRQFETEEQTLPGVITKAPVFGESEEIGVSKEPEDELFDEAMKVILNNDRASASLLQRRLRIGYARAARLLDELEERGLIGEKDGSHPRGVFAEKVQGYLQGRGLL
ncbi:MAG: DNA translocase FtsK [Candidatus Cloacimonetes bacterium]|nr:DNA translocase FtsK [Candidatus Cloacimonadota bacterium]